MNQSDTILPGKQQLLTLLRKRFEVDIRQRHLEQAQVTPVYDEDPYLHSLAESFQAVVGAIAHLDDPAVVDLVANQDKILKAIEHHENVHQAELRQLKSERFKLDELIRRTLQTYQQHPAHDLLAGTLMFNTMGLTTDAKRTLNLQADKLMHQLQQKGYVIQKASELVYRVNSTVIQRLKEDITSLPLFEDAVFSFGGTRRLIIDTNMGKSLPGLNVNLERYCNLSVEQMTAAIETINTMIRDTPQHSVNTDGMAP